MNLTTLHMNRLAALSLVLASSVANSAETVAAIPEQFHGRWAGSAAECSRGRLALQRMTISANRIEFYESIGQVLSVAVEGQSDFAVLLESRGEGYTWLSALQYRLSEDGQTLTNVTGGRLGVVLVHCESDV